MLTQNAYPYPEKNPSPEQERPEQERATSPEPEDNDTTLMTRSPVMPESPLKDEGTPTSPT